MSGSVGYKIYCLGTRLCCKAIETASVRLAALSLPRMLLTLTVAG